HVVGDYRPPPLPGAIVGSGPLVEAPGGPLRVVDLDADGEPEVLLNMYSGGAHCCEYVVVYRFVSGQYVETQRNFASAGYLLRRLQGRREFVGRDSSFDYVFTAYAFSLDPIRIWQFERGRFVAVTRSFPNQIVSHAAWLYRLYRRTLRGPAPREVRGILA